MSIETKVPLPSGYRFALLDDTGEAHPYDGLAGRFGRISFTLVLFDATSAMGHADFYHDSEADQLMCSDIFIDPLQRRRGLASALYLEAERLSGKIIHPYSAQYPDGRALWLSPNRQFGRDVAPPVDPVIEEGS